MRISIALLASLAWFACVPQAHADAMRCGSKLIREGDVRSLVRDFCGEPSDIQTRSILRRPVFNFNGRKRFVGDGLVEIPVEIWTFNFGPSKLMREVRFVDGRVEEIATLGYGYSVPASPPGP
jgi:hypothetical protein